MTRPAFPAPGTTYGPDRLNEVRALLMARPGRGVWVYRDDRGRWWDVDSHEACVGDGETWFYVGPRPNDVRDTAEPEPEPARTVTVRTWEYLCRQRAEDPWGVQVSYDRATADFMQRDDLRWGREVGPVVAVDRPLPLPIEPAVVVGEVSDGKA